jgi:hypothetical protein
MDTWEIFVKNTYLMTKIKKAAFMPLLPLIYGINRKYS